MSLVYALMIVSLEHCAEAIRLDRYHEELCTYLAKGNKIEGFLNLTL